MPVVQTQDLFSVLSFAVSVVSIVLAVVSIVFSWITFRNSTKMQVEAQKSLETVTQKVETIAEHSHRQFDKTLDALVANRVPPLPETQALLAQERDKLQVSVKQEVLASLREVGIDGEKIASLSSRVQSIAERTVEASEESATKYRLIQVAEDLRRALTHYADMWCVEHDESASLVQLASLLKKELGSDAHRIAQSVSDVRNSIAHGKPASLSVAEMRDLILDAQALILNITQGTPPS